MIENDDNGVENHFIDPFAVVSNEAYPFPVEDYIPQEPVPVIPNPDTVQVPAKDETSIPTLNEDGSVEVKDSLKVTEDDTVIVPAQDITDTPADPLDQPQGEEVRISLEEDEVKEVDGDIEVLAEIVQIHEQLKEIGGVSKDDVVAFESYFPNTITSKTPLNRFSTVATPMGLETSLESIAATIIDVIRKVIAWVVRLAKKIVSWVIARLEKAETTNLFDVKVRWTGVENNAKRIDSTGPGKGYQRKYASKEYSKKAATTTHFIQLHANAVMARVLANSNVGMVSAQKGTMFNEAKGITTRMSQMRDWITGGVNAFKTGTTVKEINTSVAGEAIDADKHSEYMAKIAANYRELAPSTIKEFRNAINVKDVRAAVANDMKTLGDAMVKLQRSLNDIDEKLAGTGDKSKYDVDGLRRVKDGMRVLVCLSLELDVHLQFFTKYCTAMMMVVNDCERTIVGLRYL